MGVVTVLDSQAVSDGTAAITGDFVLIDEEVNAVARTLRQHGIDVTAIHNHGLFDPAPLLHELLGRGWPGEAGAGVEGRARPDQQPEVSR
jgi:hypothetical protein